MARTVNVPVHQVRREAFLDVAQRLIQTRGYEQMSIQDVLDELEVSRGALYHYFDSKQALLDGVVERFADAALATVAPILNDPHLPALRKLERYFSAIASIKAEQKQLMLAIIAAWTSDGNAITREKVRRLTIARLQPVLAQIIGQGIDEGTIRCGSPDETARILLYMIQGYQELALEQFVARQAGTLDLDVVLQTNAVFTEVFERILGVPRGSVALTDEATLRYWFE